MTPPNYLFETAAFLFIFGLGYDKFVAWLHRRGYERGYTALLVIGGVAVTLAGQAVVLGIEAAIWTFLLFCCSGFWMTIGSISRYQKEREQDTQISLAELRGLIGAGQTEVRPSQNRRFDLE